MKVEIDQSGKVEKTSVDTYIADSIGNIICLKANTKQSLLKLYRTNNKPKVFTLEIFSILITYLIQKSYKKDMIYYIDIEYWGKTGSIKDFIIRFLNKLNISAHNDQIQFGLIGKTSQAHSNAYLAYKKRIKNIRIISFNEVYKYIISIKKDQSVF